MPRKRHRGVDSSAVAVPCCSNGETGTHSALASRKRTALSAIAPIEERHRAVSRQSRERRNRFTHVTQLHHTRTNSCAGSDNCRQFDFHDCVPVGLTGCRRKCASVSRQKELPPAPKFTAPIPDAKTSELGLQTNRGAVLNFAAKSIRQHTPQLKLPTPYASGKGVELHLSLHVLREHNSESEPGKATQHLVIAILNLIQYAVGARGPRRHQTAQSRQRGSGRGPQGPCTSAFAACLAPQRVTDTEF